MGSPAPSAVPDQLARALAATETLVAGVRADQWDAPTGCPGWTVRDLVEHLIGGTRHVAAVLAGQAPPPAEALGDDPLERYRRAGEALLGAVDEPGVFEKVVTVPAGTVPTPVALHLRLTELLVHGWDVARATGQPTAGLPDDLAEQELAFSRVQLQRLPPDRSPFAPPQQIDAAAPAIDRLAALLGRSPNPVAPVS
jgi:uncharacterized protein (TIGR03086 family)